MVRVSKRFADRAKNSLRRFQKIMESAKTRDVNESDTVVIVSDFLAEVLGYDKYSEVTTEFAVRSTFCDLAVKTNGRVRFLIEVKSIGTDLRENHLRQAVDYASHQGVEWVVLTNGAVWQAHRVRFEQPIQNDLVFSVDLLDTATKTTSILEKLYLISREGGGGSEIDQFYQQKEATSRYLLAQFILSDVSLSLLRRQIRTRFPGMRVGTEALADVLRAEVIKRDVLEGDKATAAERLVKRTLKKKARPAAEGAPAAKADEAAANVEGGADA